MAVRRAIFWAVAGQGVVIAATFATTVALARILSPREIGVYAIGLAVSGVLQALSAFGVGTYIVRERELTDATLASAFTINALVALLLAGALYGTSLAPGIVRGEPMVAQVLALLAIVPLIGIFEFRPATMLQRELDFRAISLATVARTVATAVVSIAAALAGASALSAAYGGVAGAVVGAAAFVLAGRRHARLALSVSAWRSMVGFGAKTLLIGGIAVFAYRLSDVLLGLILGLTALGFYNRAATLATMANQNIYATIARVLYAKLASDDRAGIGLRGAYLRGLDMILALLWPILIGFAVLAGPAVSVLFGDRWLAAAVPLAILLVAQALGLTFAMNYELFVLRDQVGRQARYEIVRSAASLAAFVVGCQFGLVGAAVSRLVDPLVGMALYLPQMRRLSGLERGDLGRTFARNGAVTLAAVGPAMVLMIATRFSPQTPLAPVAAVIGGGAGLWLVTLRWLDHPLYDEIALQLARLRR